MAVTHSTNPNRLRNVFLAGIAIGVVASLLLAALTPDTKVASEDLAKINDRLSAIEGKLTTPSAVPSPTTSGSPAPGSNTISAINKNPSSFTDQTVELQGKVGNTYQGVGFILVDADGTFLWVHYRGAIPSGTATVKGKITELRDQIAQWKNEPGWPENDSALTTKLRDEKVFIEAESAS